jgi:AcrR family transcriptional regulator
LSQTLRSDAQDNRARLLDAARTLFAADGLDVPMREVARQAGVGPATLYRHFPTKQALVTEAFTDQVHACHVVVDEGLADPDPWRGFCHVIEGVCELQARDRGFTDAFAANFPGAIDLTAARERALQSMAELAGRAKSAGRLRADFVLDDLILILMANRGIQANSMEVRVAASRRFAALVLQAFRASPENAPLPAIGRIGQ